MIIIPLFKVGHCENTIEICDDWKVLDIGSGHSPFERADIILDISITDDFERSGEKLRLDSQRFVLGDAMHLPFKDKVFDYVVASHIAEHVDDPDKFCRELIRVGKRGYIESPSKFAEIMLGEPYHKWYVEFDNTTLTFEKIESYLPFGHFFYRLFYGNFNRAGHNDIKLSDKILYKAFKFFLLIMKKMRLKKKINKILYEVGSEEMRELWIKNKKITTTYFEWEGAFSYKIKN